MISSFAIILAAVATSSAQAPRYEVPCSGGSSDTTFGFQGAGVAITRVVGEGGVNQNPDGSRANWEKDVFNQVVSRNAGLRLSMIRQDSSPARFKVAVTIKVNGVAVAATTIDQSHLCVQVSTEHLRFAIPNGSSRPLAPTPSMNSITLDSTVLECLAPNGADVPSATCQGLIPVSLSIRAMAPIIMIHGIRANYEWFIVNKFVVPFINADLPYWTLVFDSNQSIENGGLDVADKVASVAKAFGVNHVHLVCHSMGGLWAREFITACAQKKNIGVYSVHTLDTPHEGSVGANIAIGAYKTFAASDASFLNTSAKLLNYFLTDDPAVNALKVESVTDYDGKHAVLPATMSVTVGSTEFRNKTRYFSYHGDANQNGKTRNGLGIIDCSTDPCDSWGGGGVWGSAIPQLLYTLMQSSQVLVTTTDSGARIVTVYAAPQTSYDGNDFIVTMASAHFLPSFTPLTTWHVNHSTIGFSQQSNAVKYPDVANTLCNRFTEYALNPVAGSGQPPLQSDLQ